MNLATQQTQKGRMFFATLLIAVLASFAIGTGILPVAASSGALNQVMDIVINDIISVAAKFIGVIIVLWGVFQIILSLRREDSEGISKNITTVVVGGVLVGFGVIAQSLAGALGV